MEGKQFEKIEQWFLQLNATIHEINGKVGRVETSMATKDMVENRFNMLAASMKNIFDKVQKLEERLGKRDEEVVIIRLALRKLEDDVEKLRNQVFSSQL